MSYYTVLGVPENASAEAIHNAYRARARQYHPDAGEGSSPGKFREIAEAYETLSDPERRGAYDAALAATRSERTTPRYAGYEPSYGVVIEPLAQPWYAPPSGLRSVPAFRMDQWFEEVFLLFDEMFSDPWLERW